MTDYLIRRAEMLDTVLALLDASPDVWTTSKPIVRAVAEVRDGRAGIAVAAGTQAASKPEGLTEDRDEDRGAVATRLAVLGKKATAYALEFGDADLRKAVDVSRTKWVKMAEARFFSEADAALARIEARLDALDEFKVTKAEIDAARAGLDALRPQTAARNTVGDARAVATDDLDGGYSAVVNPLRRLDRLMATQIADDTFVARYREARKVTGD